MLNKKKSLYISGIGSLVAVVALYLAYHTPLSTCDYEMSLRCFSTLVCLMFGIFIPIFISSLIVYRMKEETFLSWKKFTIIYVFIYLFLIIVNPWMHADYSIFEKNTIFMAIVPLYFLLSFILIIYKSIKLRGK